MFPQPAAALTKPCLVCRVEKLAARSREMKLASGHDPKLGTWITYPPRPGFVASFGDLHLSKMRIVSFEADLVLNFRLLHGPQVYDEVRSAEVVLPPRKIPSLIFPFLNFFSSLASFSVI